MKSLFILTIFFSLSASAQVPSITPKPNSLQLGKGNFVITKGTEIAASGPDRQTAELFNEYLKSAHQITLDIDAQESRNYIRFQTTPGIDSSREGYRLTVEKDGITVQGSTPAGTFYGMQTLLQLLPTNAGKDPIFARASRRETSNFSIAIPQLTIQDAPRFSYRGMHLDVCRHFFSIAFLKKYIDYLAFHKMNTFHWHLTDDQGWRIQILKYPELTNVGAYRDGTITGRYPGTGNTNTRYGGFYTQDEVREIVKYAAARHITVIPEIEMPGHASAAIATFPYLSCFPEQETIIPSHPSTGSQLKNGKKVQETWGVFEDVFCAGKDSTFMFLQNVLDEVIALFPSQLIHIGGDESPKVNWKKCPSCQARIKSLNLKDEHQLQSYFVQRMEQYLNTKGRTIIGWDEILEGGLAPNAIVMSWQGEKGGIEAAKAKHYVIMTPQKPVYFDHSQTRNEDSLVIGGYNPLEAVYNYEPVPSELSVAAHPYIMGAQANLWTEYITNPSKVEYMVFPRMSALSEVLWTNKENKSWADFEKRIPQIFERYAQWKANYSKAYYDVKVTFSGGSAGNGLLLTAEPRLKKGEVKITAPDGSIISYTKPLQIKSSGNYTVSYFMDGQQVNAIPYSIQLTKSTGKKAKIASKPNERYPGQGGAFSLVNGIISNKGLSHPDWLGYIGSDIQTIIDLQKVQSIDSVRLHTLDQNGSWVYLPKMVDVEVSNDGKKFRKAGSGNTFIREHLTMGWITVPLKKVSARYVRVTAKNMGTIPSGMPGGGNKAWVFADEIQIF